MVELYMPLARRMASRYSGVAEPYDDLLQVAGLGLLNAVDRFDASRGTPFVGFARPTILGELKRHFRDKVWMVRVPPGVHDRMAQVEKATEKLTEELGRSPSVEELAEKVGVEAAEVLEILEAKHNRRVLSLDAPPVGQGPEDASGAEWIGRADGNFDLIEDRLVMESVLPSLDDREREVLRLRFARELPQSESRRGSAPRRCTSRASCGARSTSCARRRRRIRGGPEESPTRIWTDVAARPHRVRPSSSAGRSISRSAGRGSGKRAFAHLER
jgi:RNA polymerase sigma-B factor